MGFGIKVDVKVEAPKVELPKVDVAGAVKGAADAAAGAVAGAVSGATAAVTGAVASATAAVTGAVDAAASSLAGVAGAIGDVAVSFAGAIQDIALEPHLQLDANASYGDTHFEKGPVRVRIESTVAEAAACADTVRLFSQSGSYDRSKSLGEHVESTDTTILVIFEDAPMNESYSLQVIPARGEPHLVFSGVPYGDLRKTKQRFQG